MYNKLAGQRADTTAENDKEKETCKIFADDFRFDFGRCEKYVTPGYVVKSEFVSMSTVI